MDSTAETLKHIRRVSQLLGEGAVELITRAAVHDNTKLQEPEKSYFDQYTEQLSSLEFGTQEYIDCANKLKPAIDHHYSMNSHHPQYYPDGVRGMNLFDLIEMYYDWKASGERTKNGSIIKSIDYNSKRFRMGDTLEKIFKNTAQYLDHE